MRIAVPAGRAFLALNLLAALAVAAAMAALLVGHFAERRQDVAEMTEELQRIDGANLRAAVLTKQIAGRGNPFLSAADERLGSADLQALLQDLARTGGATFLGVRGLPAPRRPDLKLVAAKLDVEGSLETVQAIVKAIESHVPLLWIDAASLRDSGTGQEPGATLHAELQVEAALASGAPVPAAVLGPGPRP